MIKNIVFDAGDVLVRWKPHEVLASEVADPAARDIIYDNFFGSELWWHMDRGDMTRAEMLEKAVANLPQYERELRQLMAVWPNYATRNDDTVAFMRELKERHGLGVYILSNWSDNCREISSLHPAVEIANGVMFSSEVHLAKPEKAIFDLFCKKFGVRADECLFTDDTPRNVEGARAAGWQGELFTDAESLRRSLIARGVIREKNG